MSSKELLIIDELSYVTFDRKQSELMYMVLADRAEKGSTIITTNLPFSKWNDLFNNSSLINALIDKLTYKAKVLDMNGDSYRLQQAKQEMNSTESAATIKTDGETKGA